VVTEVGAAIGRLLPSNHPVNDSHSCALGNFIELLLKNLTCAKSLLITKKLLNLKDLRIETIG
jgi:hypothetical protein